MTVQVRLNVGRSRTPSDVMEAAYVRIMRDSVKRVTDNLRRITNAIEVASVEGLRHAVQPISDESQRLVPYDTGALHDSHYLEVHRTQLGISLNIGYAKGGNPFYALIVHERLDVPHEAPTTAKFLEIAVLEHQDEILPRYVEFVRGEVGL